jgi:trehalose-6-phosphate synthase
LHIVPSRQEWGIYQGLLTEILQTAEHLNRELAPLQDQAIRIHTSNNYAAALGSLRRFDVLLAPSIADGMNLVIKEGCALNTRSGLVVATRDVGAMSELAQFCVVAANASEQAILTAIHEGFQISTQGRVQMALARREAVRVNDSAKWADGVMKSIFESRNNKLQATVNLPVAPRR